MIDVMNAVNLRHITPRYRKRPKAGDYFILSPASDRYFVGRVINDSAEIMKLGKPCVALLVYVYRPEFESEAIDTSILQPDSLLFPPDIVSRSTFTDGYLKIVGHADLAPEHTLPVHLFRSSVSGKLCNEFGEAIEQDGITRDEIGFYGVSNKFGFDNLVSDALHIPRASNM